MNGQHLTPQNLTDLIAHPKSKRYEARYEWVESERRETTVTLGPKGSRTKVRKTVIDVVETVQTALVSISKDVGKELFELADLTGQIVAVERLSEDEVVIRLERERRDWKQRVKRIG